MLIINNYNKDITIEIYEDGTKKYYYKGKLSRLDRPAVEYSDGSKYWYLNGECHREDGPAKQEVCLICN